MTRSRRLIRAVVLLIGRLHNDLDSREPNQLAVRPLLGLLLNSLNGHAVSLATLFPLATGKWRGEAGKRTDLSDKRMRPHCLTCAISHEMGPGTWKS